MKVFNWVHRRFLNVQSCTSFVQENETEKDGSSKVENEKHILLDHDAHMVVEMIDQWKDGILSIGTLAISPLDEATKFRLVDDNEVDHDHDHDDGDNYDNEITNVHDDIDNVINNYDIEFEDGDEASPLMNVEFFSHELEKVIGANHEITEEEDGVVDENNVVEARDDDGVNVSEIEGETKRRVTLADLFMEDYEYHHSVKVLKELENDNDGVKDVNDIINEKQGIKMKVKPTSKTKKGFSKAKKLLKEDLHPLKKFNQLMKRMMKKKIHPDLEAKMQKDMQMNPSYGLSNPTNGHDASNYELASLLLIQDAMV